MVHMHHLNRGRTDHFLNDKMKFDDFTLVNPVLICVIFENRIQNLLKFNANNELLHKITVILSLINFLLCVELIILFGYLIELK